MILFVSSCSVNRNEVEYQYNYQENVETNIGSSEKSSVETYPDEFKNNKISLHGNITRREDIVDFQSDEERIRNYSDYINENINDIGNLESISECFANGHYLMTLFSTDNIFNPQIGSTTYINVGDNNGDGIDEIYYETGYDFNSFYQLYLNVFTENMIEELYEINNFFYSYNEELWIIPTLLTGDISVVRKEYNITEKTPEMVKIECKKYHVREGEDPIFNPENMQVYLVDYDYFTFLRTDNGWRISECPTSMW